MEDHKLICWPLVSDGTTIVNTSENTLVGPGEDVTLSCSVEGKPLTEEHVRWEREDYDMEERTETTFANGTSFLHIRSAQREDVGNFRCIADNRVANPTSRDILLIVKCKCRETVFVPENAPTLHPPTTSPLTNVAFHLFRPQSPRK